MNQEKFIEILSKKIGLSKNKTSGFIWGFRYVIKECLKRGERVKIVPFGIWEVKVKKARERRNPKTGEKVWVKERKVVVFKAGKLLKMAVR